MQYKNDTEFSSSSSARVQLRNDHPHGGGGGGGSAVAEDASPISSRPPAIGGAGHYMNVDEYMRLSEDAFGGGVSSSGGGPNRWPRQETLALLQIRSEMDAAFRDASPKGPLWEDVSRKLKVMGYNRSAKKCKEKFENVQKYYKRTKEGRAGRQDGKSYKFFSQLEALHTTTTTTATTTVSAVPPQLPLPPPTPATQTAALDVSPVSIGIIPTMPIVHNIQIHSFQQQPPPPATTVPATTPNVGGISSSTDGSFSSYPLSEDDDLAGTEQQQHSTRKRKRREHLSTSSKGETRKITEFFESLMRQVMQKQEAMQQRFLDIVEKKEQERMMRREAWARQETERMSREHELLAQERDVSASRSAAISALLQKITGQSIQLPSITPQSFTTTPVIQLQQQQPPPEPQLPPPQQNHPQQQQPIVPSQAIVAIPEQKVAPQQELVASGSGSHEAGTGSRWPKVEVLALINLRSAMESKYQEGGPKGPLWEEISAEMHRIGYKRSAKRCKEKWENINKYFKKVKESNKKRPEDSKTCPYYAQLEELYKRKIIGSSSSSGGGSAIANITPPQEQHLTKGSINLNPVPAQEKSTGGDAKVSDPVLASSCFGEGNIGATQKPEDIIMGLMKQQGTQPHDQQSKIDGVQSERPNREEEYEDDDGEIDEDEDDDDDEESEEVKKMAYKIEFQRQNNNTSTASSNGGGNNGAPSSFFTMVQN